ncbi:MAG TPA: hypothetical protein VGH27_01385 [Streptosporangiaceae bacterium]|jgi:hypothetical protein
MVVGAVEAGANEEEWALQWSGGRWIAYESPSNPDVNSDLTAVSCASATDCVVVGQAATTTGDEVTAVTQQWNGSHWTILTAPHTAQTHLTGVSCSATTSCTAVGVEGNAAASALAESWNGSTWTVQPTATPAGHKTLSGVSCLTATTCTAVGLNTRTTGSTTLAEHD